LEETAISCDAPTAASPKETAVSYATGMLDSYPRDLTLDKDVLARCIDACFDCAQACTACADACLSEESVADLVRCIRLCLDCADICATTGRVVSRQAASDATLTRAIVQACVDLCKACGDECEEHGRHGMEHCRVCAEACRRCEQACAELLSAIA
jgi:hypothetical protein